MLKYSKMSQNYQNVSQCLKYLEKCSFISKYLEIFKKILKISQKLSKCPKYFQKCPFISKYLEISKKSSKYLKNCRIVQNISRNVNLFQNILKYLKNHQSISKILELSKISQVMSIYLKIFQKVIKVFKSCHYVVFFNYSVQKMKNMFIKRILLFSILHQMYELVICRCKYCYV